MNILPIRKKLRLTQSDIANHLGVAPATVQRWESKKRSISIEKLKELARFMNCSLEELCAHDISNKDYIDSDNCNIMEKKVLNVPIISWVRAGDFSESSEADLTSSETVCVADLSPKSLFALRVVGHSMNLVAPEGSIILVNYKDKDLKAGFYYIAQSIKGMTFKRYFSSPPRLEPVSSDPSFETIFLSENTYIAGRVVKVINDI